MRSRWKMADVSLQHHVVLDIVRPETGGYVTLRIGVLLQ
jgi:hypothetical protein